MLFANTATQLLMASARIKNPTITDYEFNKWYNTQLLPAFMQNHNASLGVRYKIIVDPNSTQMPQWDYLALYKAHGNFNVSTDIVLRRSQAMLQKRDIGPDDVAIEITAWNKVQTYESLREQRGEVPAGRPNFLYIERLEPKRGNASEKEAEDWYRNQHLDMLSMLKTYRRSTRYRSADGSKPRWLAIHELDDPDIDPYAWEVLMSTDLAMRVRRGAQIFDQADWEFIFEKGDVSEKL